MAATRDLDALPTLSGAPLVGNLLEMREDWLGLLSRVADECGDAGRIRLGPLSGAVFNTPEAARDIFAAQPDAFDKGPTLSRLVRVFLGEGLITCSQADHARLRRLVAPAWSRGAVAGRVALMGEATEAALADVAPGVPLDLHELMLEVAIQVAGRALFSEDLAPVSERLGGAVRGALAWVADGIARPLRAPTWVPTRVNREACRALAVFDDVLFGLIASRRRQGPGPGDVLDVLLAAQGGPDGLTDLELRDQLATLLMAGFETAAASMAWAFVLLAERPDVERALTRQARRALASDELPTMADLDAVPLARLVFEETLRIYPAGHTLGRRTTREVVVDGVRVGPGEVVVVSPWLLHRRPDAFPDPEAFRPERFEPQARASLPRYAFIPFGAGPRACLGASFATLEARVVLVTLLSRFSVERLTAGRPEPVVSMTLRPSALPVVLRPAGGEP